MEQMYTTAEVAALLKVNPGTLRRWRREKVGPRYVKIEGQYRYKQSDLDAYLDGTKEPA